jgi:hypothetical protein
MLRKEGDCNYIHYGRSAWTILRMRCGKETSVYREIYEIPNKHGEERPKAEKDAAARPRISRTQPKALTGLVDKPDAQLNASTEGIVSDSPSKRGREITETGRQRFSGSQASRATQQQRHRHSGL